MKNIIITCGTSICNEFTISNPNQLTASQKLDANPSSFNYIYDSMIKSYEGCEDYQLGAEIYTLLKLEKDVDDTIYFFFSETKGGELVKKLFVESNILKERIGDYKYIYDTIDGFNVKDKNLFKEKAISNFYEKLEKIKSFGHETIMCPVGGYKALIPYASLYAMVHGWDIKYIYEDSDELMDLPSGALTNLTGDLTFGNTIKTDIFKSENLAIKYDFEQGLKLIFGVKNFINTGKMTELALLFEELNCEFIQRKDYKSHERIVLQKLSKYLLNLSQAFDLIRINSIFENIEVIKGIKVSELNDPLIKNIIIYLQNELIKIEPKCLVAWYFERGRYAETLLIIKEGLVDFIGEKFQVLYKEYDDRQKIEGSLKLVGNIKKPQDKQLIKDTKRYKYLEEQNEKKLQTMFLGNEDYRDQLTEKRNNFAHINADESLETMRNKIESLYKIFLKITNT